VRHAADWDGQRMKGQWIIKEVYFEDGFPKIIRDIERETPDVPPEVIPRLTPEVADHHPSITYKMSPSTYTVYKSNKEKL
jgi:hypothetical protein